MITRLSTDVNIDSNMIGIVMSDIPVSNINQGIPLYIPLFMCNIENSNPSISIAKTYGNSIFKNAQSCKPHISTILKQQNYLTAKLNLNSDINHIISIDEKGNQYIKKGTKVQSEFIHSKISDLRFNTNINF